jgi:hypothetical protein
VGHAYLHWKLALADLFIYCISERIVRRAVDVIVWVHGRRTTSRHLFLPPLSALYDFFVG